MSKAMANKISRVTHDSNRLSGSEKDALRKKHGTNRLTGSMKDEGRAKSKAIHAKMGKKIENRGNLRVVHEGNTHSYGPTPEQHKKNEVIRKAHAKRFGTSY